jgi:hypothetical protein
MKKALFFVGLIAVLSSCGSGKDEQFCKCLKAGDDLNAHSVELFDGDITKEQAEKQQKLIKTKKQACENYETMKGPEMLERKKKCAE